MATINDAFRVNVGLSLDDLNGIFPVESDPSVSPGLAAPKGSLALLFPASGPGKFYLKYDTMDTAWTQISTGGGQPRYIAVFGYNGNASSVQWLQLFSGIPSNTSPYVFAEASTIKTLSVSVSKSTTATFSVYKNGATLLDTLTLTAATANSKSGLGHEVNANDTLSVSISSGSAKDVIFETGVQVSS